VYPEFQKLGSNTRGLMRGPLEEKTPSQPVERLFAFALRSRILVVGRDQLARSKGKLHFVLITRDLSENSRSEILSKFARYPVIQLYTQPELEDLFRIRGAKVIGFRKSNLARSIYAELKEYRINSPRN